MKIYRKPQPKSWPEILRRNTPDFSELEPIVKEIFDAVGKNGDQAILDYTEKFDRTRPESLLLSQEEIAAAEEEVPFELRDAIAMAASNIQTFHAAQQRPDLKVETWPGVTCRRKSVPIEKVGLYVPGGTAPLFSTVLMLAVPAAVAGCQEILLCTPPGKDGKIHPAILWAADLVGVKTIVRAGGIQAIAGLSLGTESIPRVDKIFGPGNQYVTAAKQYATRMGVAIDLPAGPSEVLVIADETSDPAFVAADLISQAEHGIDSQAVLVTESEALLDEALEELEKQLKTLPRAEIARQALKNSPAILVEDRGAALELSNYYAPEHLILSMEDSEFFVERILNAGSVFVGPWTPESAGDYASGTNHTLPTGGFARAWSGLSLDSFMKEITFQEITPEGIQSLGPIIEKMAAAELLEGHKNAVSLRLQQLEGGLG